MEGLGYQSLFYQTYIICESGDTCLLKCASGACDSTTIYRCEDGATCNLNPKQCLSRSGGTFRGIGCPTIVMVSAKQLNKMDTEDIVKDHIDDGLDMELFGDIEIANNNHGIGYMMNILLIVVIGLLLIISVVMIYYYKKNGNDKYLALK